METRSVSRGRHLAIKMSFRLLPFLAPCGFRAESLRGSDFRRKFVNSAEFVTGGCLGSLGNLFRAHVVIMGVSFGFADICNIMMYSPAWNAVFLRNSRGGLAIILWKSCGDSKIR